jgi:hypothetical protein
MKMNTLARLISFSLFLAVAGCAGAEEDVSSNEGAVRAPGEEELTLANFESHPKLQEIFDLRSETDMAIKEEFWKIETKLDLCAGDGEESRLKGTKDGIVRVLALRGRTHGSVGGSLRSFETRLRAIYDEHGKLRSVESELRSEQLTGEDHEVFFDADGHVVWEVIREWTLAEDGLGLPGPWRKPKPIEEDPFDQFAFDDHNFVDNPPRVFDRDPTCD